MDRAPGFQLLDTNPYQSAPGQGEGLYFWGFSFPAPNRHPLLNEVELRD